MSLDISVTYVPGPYRPPSNKRLSRRALERPSALATPSGVATAKEEGYSCQVGLVARGSTVNVPT